MTTVEYPADFISRFWAKVDTSGECWLWTAHTVKGNYGKIALKRRGMMAHRVSWELANGPVPDGMFVCHNCPAGDNPRCVNPAHLWLGTAAENIHDRDAKGRTATGDRSGARTHPERVVRGERHYRRLHPELVQGERNPFAKLTDERVREMRRLYAAGGITHRALAKRFGLAKSTTTSILTGKRWTHI